MDRQQAAAEHVGPIKDAAKAIYDSTDVDMYPETMQHLLRSYGGGGATDAVRAVQLMGEKAVGEISLADIPVGQGFTSKGINRDAVDFRERAKDLDKLVEERKYAQANGTLDEFDASHPGVERGAAIYDAASREVKAIFKARKEAEKIEDATLRQTAVRDVNRQLRAVMMMANKAYREAQP
jgi:hypothetical protein